MPLRMQMAEPHRRRAGGPVRRPGPRSGFRPGAGADPAMARHGSGARVAFLLVAIAIYVLVLVLERLLMVVVPVAFAAMLATVLVPPAQWLRRAASGLRCDVDRVPRRDRAARRTLSVAGPNGQRPGHDAPALRRARREPGEALVHHRSAAPLAPRAPARHRPTLARRADTRERTRAPGCDDCPGGCGRPAPHARDDVLLRQGRGTAGAKRDAAVRAAPRRGAARARHAVVADAHGLRARYDDQRARQRVVIGVGLYLLSVPLSLPLAVLTFFGAYFPIVGSFVSGAVAALVALAANGPVSRSPSSA